MKTMFGFLLIALFWSCNASSVTSKKIYPPFSRKESIKDYAICQCILHGLNSATLAEKDNSTWGEGDICQCDPHLLIKIDSIAKIEAAKILPIQASEDTIKRPIILGCIEFAKSKKLDSLLRIYKFENR